jgi:hypothetical protein
MKKLILAVATLFVAYTTQAGELNVTRGGGNDKKMVIGVSIGAAIPMGAYGSKNTDTTASVQNDSTHVQNGYAKTGFHFDLTAGYLFNSSVGAMVFIGGNMNSWDATTYMSVNRTPSGETYTATSYYLGQYMVGPFVQFGQGQMKFTGRLLLGLVTANRPTITDTYTGGSSTQSGSGASGFGWQLAAGIQYNFNDNMGLTVNIGYTGATVNYTGYNASGTSGSFTYNVTNTTLKQSMSVGLLTASVGLAFNL